MILILSSPDDLTTNQVIDWLLFYKRKFLRISLEDNVEYCSISIRNEFFEVDFKINNKKYKLSDFTAFWYRRSHFNIFYQKITSKSAFAKKLNNHFASEANEIHKLIRNHIEKHSLNKYDDIHTNKLQVLKMASNLGLKIPDTLITNSKKELELFFNRHKGNIITKNYSPGVFLFDRNRVFETFTRLVDENSLKDTSQIFISSLFQENIEKAFELRIFFIDGEFYASAIFLKTMIKQELISEIIIL